MTFFVYRAQQLENLRSTLRSLKSKQTKEFEDNETVKSFSTIQSSLKSPRRELLLLSKPFNILLHYSLQLDESVPLNGIEKAIVDVDVIVEAAGLWFALGPVA